MADSKPILEQLRENNPFASLASPLPFENTNPDIQQLNRETSDTIEQLLRQKRRAPSVPLAGLILGEAGSGKTHMLARILRKLRNNASTAIFVAVRTFRDPDSVTQYLLSEMFISLKSMHSGGRTQFDVIVSEVMNTYNERRRNDGFTSTENLDLKTYLGRDMPNLDRNFLKCLLLYMTTNDETVKANVLDWLETGLDDNDSLSLGLPMKDIHSMTDAKRESIAEKTIISLGTVLAYAKIPMLVCFDQLEAMKDRKIIEAWGNVVAMLINDLPGVLPLCFIKFEVWRDVFMPVLDDAVLQRIRSNTMIMNTCTIAQAKHLIHDKIAYVFKDNAEEKYKWLISRMGDTLSAGLSPRDVIELANRAIINSTSDPKEDIYLTIANAYSDECKKIRSDPVSWPPNADQLTLALEVWLNAHEGLELSEGDGKTLKFRGTYGDRHIAFAVVAAKSHFVASAGLKKGTAFLSEYPDGLCCYITEEKTHKKTWKQANENMRIFQEAGGKVIMLDGEARTDWYGLTALINRIDNGDVNLYVSSQPKPATRDDIRDFLKSLKLIPDLFNAKPTTLPLSKPKSTVIEPDVMAVNLKSVINSSPMNIVSVEKAIELLSQRKIITERNELVSFVKSKPEMFKTFQSKNDIVITLTDKK